MPRGIRKKPKVKFEFQLNTSYESIRQMVANDKYNDHFSKVLFYELARLYGKMRTTRILKPLAKNVEIVNKETFLRLFSVCGGDLGWDAWKESGDDLTVFTSRVLSYMSLMRGRGASEIDLSSVFFFIAYFKGYCGGVIPEATKWKIDLAIRNIAAASVCAKFNPFFVRIVHPFLVEPLAEKLGLENSYYYRSVVETYFKTLDEYYDRDISKCRDAAITFPRVEYLIPVYQDVRKTQLVYLATKLRSTMKEVKEAVKGIEDLGKPSVELNIALEKMKQKKKLKDMVNDKLIEEMAKIAKDRVFYSYPAIKDEHRYATSFNIKVTSSHRKRYKIQDIFVERETLLDTIFEGMYTIRIDCATYDYLEQIEPIIYSAAEVFNVRKRNNFNEELVKKYERAHIELLNVREYDKGFMDRVKALQEKVSSQYNRPIVISVQYSKETAMAQFQEDRPLYLRVVSDIHADINKDRNYLFDFGNDFVVNCGDIASTAYEERAWIRTFMNRGIVVAGNHLGYKSNIPELDGIEFTKDFQNYVNPANTRNAQIEKLTDCFQRDGCVRYLSNNMVEEEGIIFIGNTLYTDFKLFGEENQAACMIEAARKMNDFRLCHSLVRDKSAPKGWKVTTFTPEEQVKLNEICVGYIRNRLNYLKRHHSRKPIVIVTHHMPLPLCVSDKYKNDPLSAAFASDLTWLLDQFPRLNIRLWCSGHTHDPYDFIYNGTRFVCAPWGYFNENGYDEKNYGVRIPLSDIRNTTSWRKLIKADIKEGKVKDCGYSETYYEQVILPPGLRPH